MKEASEGGKEGFWKQLSTVLNDFAAVLKEMGKMKSDWEQSRILVNAEECRKLITPT